MKESSELKTPFDRVTNFFAYIGGLVVLYLLLSICLSVVTRYVFRTPLGWVVQISEYCVAFIAFLGAAWLERKNKHIKVEIFLDRLSHRTQTVLEIFTSILSILISVAIAIVGIWVVIDLYSRDVRSVDILELPMAPIISLIPLGLILFAIAKLMGIVDQIRHIKALK